MTRVPTHIQITPSEAELARLAAWLRAPGAALADLAPPEQALAALGLRGCGGVPRPRAKAAAALFAAVLPGLAADACGAAAAVAAACEQVRGVGHGLMPCGGAMLLHWLPG